MLPLRPVEGLTPSCVGSAGAA
ncbi:hypothetical protein AVEN_68548-1, partial [Araneus ventricosus]